MFHEDNKIVQKIVPLSLVPFLQFPIRYRPSLRFTFQQIFVSLKFIKMLDYYFFFFWQSRSIKSIDVYLVFVTERCCMTLIISFVEEQRVKPVAQRKTTPSQKKVAGIVLERTRTTHFSTIARAHRWTNMHPRRKNDTEEQLKIVGGSAD